jgi:hypothetical protein
MAVLAVAAYPTTARVVQHLLEAMPFGQQPSYLCVALSRLGSRLTSASRSSRHCAHCVGSARVNHKLHNAISGVLLTNGSVYFGHLQGCGGHNPVLTDVLYIVTQTNPETKQSNNVLVKRGKELHAPDRMYLNPSALLFVEPVGPNSKVAQLIAQAEH